MKRKKCKKEAGSNTSKENTNPKKLIATNKKSKIPLQ